MVSAGDVIPGDVLWSDATMRELVVLARSRELVESSGNLLREEELGEPGDEPEKGPKVPAIVLLVRNPDGSTQRLGAFAPHARLQVVR